MTPGKDKTFKIRFKAKLFRPAESEKAGSWTFLVLPKNASAKLPSRGMTAIEGTINGFPFQADARARRPKKPLAQSGPKAVAKLPAQTRATLSR